MCYDVAYQTKRSLDYARRRGYDEASIKELAGMLVAIFERHPLRSKFPPFAGFRVIESSSYYGKGYQDVQYRKPSIRNAKKLLGWTPTVDLENSVERTLDFFLRTGMEAGEFLLFSEPKLSAPHKIIEIPHGGDKGSMESKVHEDRLKD